MAFSILTINENQRWDKVMFHRLGEDATNDKLIFEVKNSAHFVSSEKSTSREYLFINSGDYNGNEIDTMSMHDESFTPKLVRPLESHIFYDVAHHENYFYIKTNYKAKNFRIVKVPVDNFQNDDWHNESFAMIV